MPDAQGTIEAENKVEVVHSACFVAEVCLCDDVVCLGYRLLLVEIDAAVVFLKFVEQGAIIRNQRVRKGFGIGPGYILLYPSRFYLS